MCYIHWNEQGQNILVSLLACVWHVTLQHKDRRFILMAWWSTSFTQLLLQHASSIREKKLQFSYQFYYFQNIIPFHWINTLYAEQNHRYCYVISHLKEVPLHFKKKRETDRPLWLKWQLTVCHQLNNHPYVFKKPLTLKVIVMVS